MSWFQSTSPSLRPAFSSRMARELRPRIFIDEVRRAGDAKGTARRIHVGVGPGVAFGGRNRARVFDRLQAELERTVGRELDLVDLRNAPPLVAHQVVSRGELLLPRDEDERAAFAARVLEARVDYGEESAPRSR